MKNIIFRILSPVLAFTLATSCQNGSIEHIGATKLVILQKVPVSEGKFDEDFKATLELLYPHECHDTVFIQEQVFLERIDLNVPFKKEFRIPPSLLRDFFGSNNPDKKKTMREDLFYNSDTSFEKNPGGQFSADPQIDRAGHPKAIGEYLSRNRKNSLVYLVSIDTLCTQYMTGGATREVHSDFAKLNCRIVEDLRKKAKEELLNTTVILILIPPETVDSTANPPQRDTVPAVKNHRSNPAVEHAEAPVKRYLSQDRSGSKAGRPSGCPQDSVVNKLNRQYGAVITEFRNLLHYIATTSDDADLKRKFREDAFAEIHKIPQVVVEGIPGNDLVRFLHSGFGSNVSVTAVTDHCRVIAGIRIGD